MACDEYKPLIRRHGEGSLPEGQQRLLYDHVAECAACRKTLRLLEMPDKAVGAALLAGTGRPDAPRGLRRAARFGLAAVVFVLLLVAALFVTYRQISRSGDAWSSFRSDPAFRERVEIRAEEMPLSRFLAELTTRSGVPFRMDPSGLHARGDPPITLLLPEPIPLLDLMALLADRYGLEFAREGGGVRVR